MSLEKAIEDQTAAIKEQTAVLALIVAALKSGAVPVGGTVAANPDILDSNSEKPTTKAEKKVEKKPETKAAAPEPVAVSEPTTETDSFALPEGELNPEYYMVHIAPLVVELVRKDRPKALDLITGFGVKRGQDVPTDKWDEFYKRLKLNLQGLPA